MTGRQIIELILTTAREIGPKEIYGRGMFDMGKAIRGPAFLGDEYFDDTFDVDTKGHDSVWENDIAGPGRLVKRGDGTLAMSGANSYSGGTSVLGGTLVLTGSLDSKLEVGPKGTLSGTGRVDSVLTLSGALSPGLAESATGTMHVENAATLEASSTYTADVIGTVAGGAQALSHDRLRVGGTATLLGGTLRVQFQDGLAPVDTDLPFVTAGKALDGKFGKVETNSISDFLDMSVSYGASAALTFRYNGRSLAGVAQTPNERAVAAALDSAKAGDAWKYIVQLDAAAAQDALGQYQGQVHAGAKTAMIEDSYGVRARVNNRLLSAFDTVGAEPTPVLAYGPEGPERVSTDADRLTLWSSAYGGWGRHDGDANAAALDVESRGLLLGGDLPLGDNWRLGLFVGYGNGSYETGGSSADADSYHVGLYGGGRFGALSLRGGVGQSWTGLKTRRKIDLPGINGSYGADYDATTTQAFAEAGWRVDARGIAFEPFAGLAHVHLNTDGFHENAGVAGLSSGGYTTDTTFTTLGLRSSAEVRLGSVPLSLDGTVAWRHAFGDTATAVPLSLDGMAAFAIEGPAVAKDVAVVGAGATLNLSETAALNLRYEGQFGADFGSHNVSGTLRIRF